MVTPMTKDTAYSVVVLATLVVVFIAQDAVWNGLSPSTRERISFWACASLTVCGMLVIFAMVLVAIYTLVTP